MIMESCLHECNIAQHSNTNRLQKCIQQRGEDNCSRKQTKLTQLHGEDFTFKCEYEHGRLLICQTVRLVLLL